MLCEVINFTVNQKASYIYDATGIKQQKVADGTTTDYAGSYIYENGSLKFVNHQEGYIEPDGAGGYEYVYQYKDHLGNVRLSYSDSNGNGLVDGSEIVEENHFYPFGLKHRGYNAQVNGTHHPYTFIAKEEQQELDLNWHDFGARNYDAALGRWMNIDNMSEDYFSYTPYSYSGNSPIKFKDEDGNIIRDPNGNIVYTTDGSTVSTGPQAVDQVRHTNGYVSVTYIDRTYSVGNIYADNGTAIEAYSLTNATQTTVTYDSQGNVISSNTGSVNQSQYDCVADCHGRTFADNKIWINNDQVNNIIANDNYTNTDDENLAGIAVFQENGQVVHSAVRNPNGTYDDNAGILTTETGRTLQQASRGLTSGLTIATSKNGNNGNVHFFFKTTPDKVLKDKRINNLGTEKNGVRKITKKKEIATFLQILNGN